MRKAEKMWKVESGMAENAARFDLKFFNLQLVVLNLNFDKNDWFRNGKTHLKKQERSDSEIPLSTLHF